MIAEEPIKEISISEMGANQIQLGKNFLGIKGGLIVGVSVAEVLTSYWRSKHNQSQSLSKVYLFGRRGTVELIFFIIKKLTPGCCFRGIFYWLGDILEWFKFKKT